MQIVKWGGALDSNFTSNKWHHKLKRLQNRDKYRRIGIIGITIFVVFISIIYFTYSKFTSSGRFTIVDTTVQEFSQSDYVIASYIYGIYSNTIPTKEEALSNNLSVSEVKCDNGAIGTWDNDKWAITIENATQKTKCSIYFSRLYLFEYTGNVQTFEAPEDGIYQLEVWGAQGGSASNNCHSGYGGYSTGKIELKKSEKLYIYVGGSGIGGLTHGYKKGGWNGGGNALADQDGNTRQASGGGATDIRTTLNDEYNDRIIVAGGGGGSAANIAGMCASGGDGGGFAGNDGSRYTEKTGYSYGLGGNQTTGGGYVANFAPTSYHGNGTLGIGASALTVGAGGGYYGGGGSTYSSGGGSGYIGSSLLTDKVMYCYNCQESNEVDTKTISTTNVSENPISNYAKIGNGYAKIYQLNEQNYK